MPEMTTTTIIVAVLASLFVLVAVTFTLQQIEKTNRDRKALIAALRSQTRNFHYLLEGFPEGFLSRDLKLLVGQCLNDGLDQLLRLEPRNPQHQLDKRQLEEKLAQIHAGPETAGGYQPLRNGEQIQEVQKLLNSLYNVVQRLYKNKRLSGLQADQYGRQIKRLATRVALDAHLSAAQQAIGAGKPRLAVHHYGLAIDKMTKDNADGIYSAQIAACQQRRDDLENSSNPHGPAADDEAVSGEWKEFEENQDDNAWKKKTVYD